LANLEQTTPVGLGERLAQVRSSRLVRQNLVLFVGGLVAGVGGFVYHAIAGRVIPAQYGEVASLVAAYAIGTTVTLILILILARYAAKLRAEGNEGGIRYLIGRSLRLLAAPIALLLVLTILLSGITQDFLHLDSRLPVIWLGVAVGAVWLVAIPRGLLQGTQAFGALSANLALEMVVRTVLLVPLISLFGVTGSVVAVSAGAAIAFGVGMGSLRRLFTTPPQKVRMRTMAAFSITAAIGTLGIMLLYNQDVILAKHYLDPHAAGTYGALNKIGTILYFLSLSVSQVMFPRVVEAIATNTHPGRLLMLSVGLMCALGGGSLLVFGVLPGLVVRILFPAFPEATALMLPMGVIGLALSLNNLLVQFFMAAHDRWFIPLLGASCLLEGVLIFLFHRAVSQVVADVLIAVLGLLGVLAIRCLILLPRLHPQPVEEATLGAA
jgi:O-antigen/teichoic acid export membrane protein